MTVTPRIVDGLILYGDQAYSAREWRERNRQPFRTPEQKERRRTYNREYARWYRLVRPVPRLIGSLHSLACTGPIRATGCRCHKIRCYSKPPALRVAE